MCGYSTTAEKTRKAVRGENLVVTEAHHPAALMGGFNWLTEPGKPTIAVCMLTGTMFSVQIREGEPVRGAEFIEAENPGRGEDDMIVYLDGDKEQVTLNSLPFGTMVTVLRLPGDPEVPEVDHSKATTGGIEMATKIPVTVGS